MGIATPAHPYSDKPAPLTEERVREIVREELAAFAERYELHRLGRAK